MITSLLMFINALSSVECVLYFCYQCDKVMTLPATQRCEFVLNTTDCHVEGGFINYPYITFCLFPPKLLPLAIFFYVSTPTFTNKPRMHMNVE